MAFDKCTTIKELISYSLTGDEESKAFEDHVYNLLWANYKDTGVFTDEVKCQDDIRCLCTPAFAFMAPKYFIRTIKQDHQPHTTNLYGDIARLTKMVSAVRSHKTTVEKVSDDNTVKEMAMSAILGLWPSSS